MSVHLDTGRAHPRCNRWLARPHWDLTMFAQDVTCGRCRRLLENDLDLGRPLHSSQPSTAAGSRDQNRSSPPSEGCPPSDTVDREGWLEWRRGGLGGSDMAAILGLSPWSTPFDVWLSKTKGVQLGDSRAMRQGRHLERAVGEDAATHWGTTLVEVGPREHAAHPVLRGTADFLLGDGSGLECKTTSRKPWAACPTHYEVQCRVYMEVYDVDVWRLAALHYGTEYTFWEFERDREVGVAIVERAVAWWERHIVGGERPPVEGSGARAFLAEEHRKHTGDYLPATAELDALVDSYELVKGQISALEQERDRIAFTLMTHIGDDAGVQGDDYRVTWSRYERRRTDFRALKADPHRAAQLDAITKPFEQTEPASRLTITRSDNS